MTHSNTSASPATADDADPIRLAPRARIVDEVVHRLRESILNHVFPPGERLVQTELADRLGVSRTPLREAIRLLEQEGLVQVSDGNRTVEVVRLSRRDIAELYAIREVIDGLAARTLAERGMDDAAREEIGTHLAAMSAAMEPFRGEDFFVAHLGFHTAIVEHCGNRRLASQLPLVRLTAGSLRDEYPKYARQSARNPAADAKRILRTTEEEHTRIFEALQSGDGAKAERVARLHIAHATTYFPEE